jgi:ParB family transcriptional regulator, chromosome partitioning protein
VWSSFPPPFSDELALYEAVRGLSDHDLTGLQTILAALSFGQEDCDRLDAQDSLFNRVARDLGVDMRRHWRPDAAFLGKRNREQLVAIAKECGYADTPGQLSTYKKADLVNALARYFQSAQAEADPTPAQQKAREWLPEAMLFPAVDPNAPSVSEIDEETEDSDTE